MYISSNSTVDSSYSHIIPAVRIADEHIADHEQATFVSILNELTNNAYLVSTLPLTEPNTSTTAYTIQRLRADTETPPSVDIYDDTLTKFLKAAKEKVYANAMEDRANKFADISASAPAKITSVNDTENAAKSVIAATTDSNTAKNDLKPAVAAIIPQSTKTETPYAVQKTDLFSSYTNNTNNISGTFAALVNATQNDIDDAADHEEKVFLIKALKEVYHNIITNTLTASSASIPNEYQILMAKISHGDTPTDDFTATTKNMHEQSSRMHKISTYGPTPTVENSKPGTSTDSSQNANNTLSYLYQEYRNKNNKIPF